MEVERYGCGYLRGFRPVRQDPFGGEALIAAHGKLRILYVAYPLLPVTNASAGGAEQMLSVLERQMAARGHSTVVAACEGSECAGELFATGAAPAEPDRFEQRDAEHSTRIVEFIWQAERSGAGFDLVHDESGHFWKHASAVSVPVLATLHLPRHFYRADPLESVVPNLFFNCVSESQRRTFEDLPGLIGVVRNGIELEKFPAVHDKGEYALWIGRICEEKGAHIAIDVARRAGLPLILAGEVYPFSYHRSYFSREILPHLQAATANIQFVQKPSFEAKVKLLQQAKALLVPALADETSSLVAMEAMACGTPVVALRRGALPEVVADGATGFVVDTGDDMVDALKRISEISPERCRVRAQELYSSERMTSEYEAVYRAILSMSDKPPTQAVRPTVSRSDR